MIVVKFTVELIKLKIEKRNPESRGAQLYLGETKIFDLTFAFNAAGGVLHQAKTFQGHQGLYCGRSSARLLLLVQVPLLGIGNKRVAPPI